MPPSIQCREGDLIFPEKPHGAFGFYKWIRAPEHENTKDLRYPLMKWAAQMASDALEELEIVSRAQSVDFELQSTCLDHLGRVKKAGS